MAPWEIEQAKQLRAQGLNYREIGDRLGRDHVSIWNALNPEKARVNKHSARRPADYS
jgi:hypothetical protein